MKQLIGAGLIFSALIGVQLSYGDYSPLSIHEEGYGLSLSLMGSRERGMGDAGMASLDGQGYYLPNASRTAYFERTSFNATLESDLDWIQDHATSNRFVSYTVPNMATTVKTKNFGAFGAYYQQAYHRRFSLLFPASPNGVEQEYFAEGNQSLLGLSYAYAPIPLFALGYSHSFVLGRDRFINSAKFRSGELQNATTLEGDTLEWKHSGNYPTLSLTVHTHFVDAALAYSTQSELTTTRERKISNLKTNPLADTTRELPFSMAFGLAWKPSTQQTIAWDFLFQNWEDRGPLNPAYKTALGWELRGSQNPFDRFRKRLTYRSGLGYEILYLNEIPEIYGTLGLGMPLGFRGHKMDLSMRYGHRSYAIYGFEAEDYLKISFSVIGVGNWGQPVRARRK